ncbi:hypothetical protein [Kitasatospora phosalacinea]|uniref:hypothetical protein n=1 Tax=Kitasatospora phosalacinea TaxID=2065 RepID=UPI000A5791E6
MNDTPAVPGGPDEARRDHRPGYGVVAEQILELIARARLVAGDRLPTENER